MPASLQRAVADPYGERPWQPPALIPPRTQLQEGIASLRVHLQPASRMHIAMCLARLALVTRYRAADEREWQARIEEYQRLLAEIPPDIWDRACDELARTSKFFPTVAELSERMEPALQLRKRQLDRLQRLLQHQQHQQQPFQPEPEAVRLQSVRDAYLKAGNAGRAARAEIQLARLEQRQPAAWALDAREDEQQGPKPHRPAGRPNHVQATPDELLATLSRRSPEP